ncbi:MAG: FtsW/RodA/SpoVE family cell cycle protein [bacterium]|nr:FtsW/RodA/SpoVE family cell cycle protein [bacterium]
MKLRHFDWALFFVVLILFILGMVAIYSIDLSRAPQDFFNFKKQAVFGVLGLFLFFIFSLVDWRVWRNSSRFLYVFGFLMLLAVLFLGQTRRASTGWFSVGGLSIQPVELAKLCLIIGGAAFFSRLGLISNWRDVGKSVFILLLYLIPVAIQPDLGGALILFVIWLGMFLALKIPKKYLAILAAVGAVLAVMVWFFFMHDYQKDRLLVFIQPDRDPLGRGYNISQALVAIGSGGFLGQGLGGGSQSQLRFLPEAQTDFIFAVLAEELGFAAVTFIIGAWIFLLYCLVNIAKRASDNFSLFFLVGTIVLLGAEAAANVGMNLGLLPVAGLTLPFVSLGGSSLVTKFVLLGVAQSMRIRSY